MGACRETQNIFYYIKNLFRYGYKKHTFETIGSLIKNFDRTTFDDTFMPIVCVFIGHKTYIPDKNEPSEIACKRCHKYVKRKFYIENMLIAFLYILLAFVIFKSILLSISIICILKVLFKIREHFKYN